MAEKSIFQLLKEKRDSKKREEKIVESRKLHRAVSSTMRAKALHESGTRRIKRPVKRVKEGLTRAEKISINRMLKESQAPLRVHMALHEGDYDQVANFFKARPRVTRRSLGEKLTTQERVRVHNILLHEHAPSPIRTALRMGNYGPVVRFLEARKRRPSKSKAVFGKKMQGGRPKQMCKYEAKSSFALGRGRAKRVSEKLSPREVFKVNRILDEMRAPTTVRRALTEGKYDFVARFIERKRGK
jgi:hypothetical protein